MRFSTIFTVLAAGAMAFASAVPEIVAKRTNSEVVGAFNTLNSACDTILPKLNGCHDNDCSTKIFGELIVAIGGCTNTLVGLNLSLGTLTVANTVVGVVTRIINALATHKTQCGSGCDLVSIYADVDVSLSLCLKTVFGLCLGLLLLVTPLLLGLVATLESIGLTLVLTVCSLL